jgi:hypothetical protein
MKENFNLKSILVIALVLFSYDGNAQTSPKEIADIFFSDYMKSGASIALDNLYSTNKWMDRATDAITNSKSQLEGMNEEYIGKYYGYELIVEKHLAESYVLLSYIVKYDRQPLRFTFQFYKPNDKWKIFSLQFDSNIDEEIEEAAKLNYLNYNDK